MDFLLHQCTKHPQNTGGDRSVPTLSVSCASKVGTAELVLQPPAAPPGDGSRPFRAGVQLRAAAAESIRGEFTWNSGLWLNPAFQLPKHLISSYVSISHFLPIFGCVSPSDTHWHYGKQLC